MAKNWPSGDTPNVVSCRPWITVMAILLRYSLTDITKGVKPIGRRWGTFYRRPRRGISGERGDGVPAADRPGRRDSRPAPTASRAASSDALALAAARSIAR